MLLAEILDTGISVSELVDRDHAIPFENECVTAFIGRTVCGPLNRAVQIDSSAEFSRIFGGAWSGSLLADALDQYFKHGGRCAVVVRVSNGATGAEILLPGTFGELRLVASNPGSGESIRVAVDFDGIESSDKHCFNLTIQRLTGPDSRISDQEIFRGVSVDASARRYVVNELLSSRLVRVKGDVPIVPPLPTGGMDGTGDPNGYVSMWRAGSDGEELTDYDLVGSASLMTGLFALDDVEHLDFLYVPPRDSEQTHGLVFLAAAERYCSERNAMLIVDPPVSSGAAETSVVRSQIAALTSEHVITYFPRPKYRSDSARSAPVGAALAGILAAQTEAGDIAAAFDHASAALGREYVTDHVLGPDRALVFARNGVNALCNRGDGRLKPVYSVTTAKGLYEDVASLRIARLANFVRRSLEFGTRWVVFGKPGHVLWRRLELQVADFFDELGARGLLRRTGQEPWFFVHCNSVTNAGSNLEERETNFLVGFTPAGESAPLVFSITQSPAGSKSARAAFVADLNEKG